MVTIFIDHQPMDRIAERGHPIRDSYTDGAPIEIELPKYAVAVICSPATATGQEPKVVAVGAFRRSLRVTSFARRYEVSNISILENPVPVANIVTHLPPQAKTHIVPALASKKPLPKKSSETFCKILQMLSAETKEIIERAAGFTSTLHQISIGRRKLLAEEKDTFGLIAELSGLGRGVKDPGRHLVVPAYEVDSNRTLLETVRLGYHDEDALLNVDMQRFDGFLGRPARMNARGMVVPLRGGGKLTVLNTNRTNLEHTRGCDLVYYNANRRSCLLIQYKRMKPEGNKWVYRGDAQLKRELARMRSHNIDEHATEVAEYRLNAQPHYLKVVRPIDYDGQSTELMKGLYLPLNLIDLMHQSPADTTKHGSLRVTWDDKRWPTQRHLNNTQLTELFRDGWIGSCGTTTDQIRSWIEPLFEADELVTVAIAEY